jgi:hypothetical protein
MAKAVAPQTPGRKRYCRAETTATGLRQTRTHRADAATVGPPRRHVHAVAVPSDPAPRHTRSLPSDGTRRSKRGGDSEPRCDVPRRPLVAGPLPLSLLQRQTRVQGRVQTRWLGIVFSRCFSCAHYCRRRAIPGSVVLHDPRRVAYRIPRIGEWVSCHRICARYCS